MAGRGFGKTRAGAEFVRAEIESKRASRVALIGKTPADVRDVMIEGESGLLNISPPWNMPHYEPSKRKLTWPNGAIALTFSSYEPDQLRGPQHDLAWCDELRTWAYARDTWDNLMFGLRLGQHPRVIITTTPSPIEVIRTLLKQSTTVVSRGTTYENRAFLAPTFYSQVVARYAGTRLGRQEIDAELLEDVPGALWKRSDIKYKKPPDLQRIVVAIDPATTSGEGSDETGIVVAGKGIDGFYYILADRSARISPDGWAKRAIQAYQDFKADRIIGETNNGGEMIELTLRTIDRTIPYKAVHASRGKQARAEPISALYEQGKVFHAETFTELEDQLCIAEGTLITTADGDKQIESLKVGELALTREGYRKIKWVDRTGIKSCLHINTEMGYNISVTDTHPVYSVKRGFVSANSLKIGEQILCLTQLNEPLLNSVAKNTSSEKMDIIAQAEVEDENYCMGRYGKAQMAHSLKVGKSTTKMGIEPTIPSKILKGSPIRNIPRNIYTELQYGQRNVDISTGRKYGLGDNHENTSVKNAASDLCLSDNVLPSVAPNVSSDTIINIVRTDELVPVWNLTVEDAHEFFANGILLHNCIWTPESGESPDRLDALVWAMTELSSGKGNYAFEV